jgi:hypothetical protein
MKHTLHLLLRTLDISARTIQIVSASAGHSQTQIQARSVLGHDVCVEWCLCEEEDSDSKVESRYPGTKLWTKFEGIKSI